LLALFVLTALVASGQCIAAPPQTTPPYEFVEVFVDQLVAAHQIETQAAQDVAVARTAPDGTQLVLMSAIRSCTRMRLELAVGRLNHHEFGRCAPFTKPFREGKSKAWLEIL
jgi:hypothetical protein